MPSKRQYEQTHGNSRREFLEHRTTEELLAAIDPSTPADQRKIYVGDGGKTLIRQILAEREASGR
jgi:hypothetical protein